ncbi:hypothetical protein ABT369_38935 [Dactylosporangium sp. NPDC000244]|uniref:hypothetical protein n=1 Tax=Dactylosporangium sp. NPDC000244 TaxID=3154365 RepID=UPI00332C84BF
MTNHVKRFLDSPAVTRVVQVVAVLSLLLAITVGVKQYSLASCLQDYQDANAQVNAERAAAAEQDRKAQDALFEAIANDPQNAVVALRAYNTARGEADRKRQQNPPPPPPSLKCG